MYTADELQFAAGWFFYRLYSYGIPDAPQQFVAGLLSDTASAGIPLTLTHTENVAAWVGTAEGIFWTGGRVIRQRFNAE